MKNNSGFTLLEVMIAVSITALIGIASASLLSNIVESRNATDIRSRQLIELQRFNQVVSNDAEQMINRPHRDLYGSENGSLILDGVDYIAEWTRLGWRNSPIVEDPRSNLQRVAYQLHDIDEDACENARKALALVGATPEEGSCLIRYFWNVVDFSSDSEPRAQILLNQVENLEVELLARPIPDPNNPGGIRDEEGDWHTSWPALSAGSGTQVPVAMRWKVTLPVMGEIERLWLLAYDDQ